MKPCPASARESLYNGCTNLLVMVVLGYTLGKNDRYDKSKSIEGIIKKALKDGGVSELKDVASDAFNTFVFGSRSQGDEQQDGPQTGNSQTERNYRPPTPTNSYSPPSRNRPIQATPQALSWSAPKPAKRRIPRGLPRIVLGSLGTFIFGLIAIIFLAVGLGSLGSVWSTVSLVLAAGSGIIALGGAVLLGTGIGKYKLAERATRVIERLQQEKTCDINTLAAGVGQTPKQLKRDLRKIQEKNLLPELRTDPDMQQVMWGHDTYEHYLAAEETRRRKLEEEEARRLRLEDPTTADIERFRNEGKAIIRKIRSANDAIPGEEISAKLDTLEGTVGRIFTYVERYPEKLPDTRKFMNHYLPITLKLVEKYQQYDRMDFEPLNVRQTKAEIERSMDTINVAFNNLLESLFTHDTMDVATDIDVLEKMLEQEGLTGKTFKIDQPGSVQ
ncbi:MAG TPA: hypothetical protein DEB24_00140 [Coriobacteriia bacterium]|nr:hypothetical protein [Coriobacteriia bacterium]